ncbi:MAG: hypothetical protein K2X00_05000 [Nitrospiraceae bacterium]|nr:hypothetical protein [Nitrospiraceae bacterium]OQW66640.1 MAG: hypothetical protein BVN29_05505 [Nitrospira sp. ST-bin5]
MAKKSTAVQKRTANRNWIAYLCEALVTSGVMPTWEAATYLTENLFGEKPNPRLLSPSHAHETTAQFLRRLYAPIAEAAMRDSHLPTSEKLHVFTDISLTGNSAVLVVHLSKTDHTQHLLLLDPAKAWDLVFADAESFNLWAEARYRSIFQALQTARLNASKDVLETAV